MTDETQSNGEALPETVMTFGIGCFHFAVGKPNNPSELDAEYYCRKVVEHLKSDNLVESVDFSPNVNVFWDSDADYRSDTIPNDDAIVPWPVSGHLSFSLHMPHRLQEQFIGGFRERLESEKINVFIQYGSHLPIAFVSTSLIESSPSTAVVIAWKHLRKFSEEKKGDVYFQLLGPSPFHADFYVHQHSDNPADVTVVEQAGYDDIHIQVPSSADENFIFERVVDRFSEEASVYYDVIRQQNSLTSAIYRSLDDLNSMVEGSQRTSFWPNYKSLNRVYEIQVELERHSITLEGITASRMQASKSIEQRYGRFSLSYKVEELLSEINLLPISRYQRIGETIKQRISNNVNNYTTIIAATSGAIFGAILTAAVTIAVAYAQYKAK